MPSGIKQHGFDMAKALEFHYQFKSFFPCEALLPESSKPLAPEWASFKQILVMRNRGQPTYFHDSGSEYSISAILGLFESASKPGAGGNTTNISHSTMRDFTHANDVSDSFNGKE